MNVFLIFWFIFLVFLGWVLWKAIKAASSPIMKERAEIKWRMDLVKRAHEMGRISEDEYYEEYYDYKEKMKDWEIKSGFAEMRKRQHPYWKDYYRRHEERKNKK